MKRWLTHAAIAAYLSALAWGIFAHAVTYKVGAHPLMYFVVWDMFCGWASHESRHHVIGEAQDGAYYELSPGPWGDFNPYGSIGRRHYDTSGMFAAKMATNCLKHSQHPPMSRIFVVEECWPKKFNLPDPLWQVTMNEPKDIVKYYHLKHIFDTEGQLVRSNGHWIDWQVNYGIANNPRLAEDARRGMPLFDIPRYQQNSMANTVYSPGQDPSIDQPIGSPLGQ